MIDLGQTVAVGIVGLVVGWHAAGVWRETVREIRRQRYAKADEDERVRLGMDDRRPPREMYHLAFHGTSGLWAVGDTEREARKLALARWTRLGEGLPPELRTDDPTPEAWAAGLTIAYVEIDGGEQAMREILLPSFIDADMAPTPWNPEPTVFSWEEA